MSYYRLIQKKLLVQRYCHRLQTVIIENIDFEKFIQLYNGETTFFYLDPPYFGTENYYEGFMRKDFIRLCDSLNTVKGKFLMSINDCEKTRHIFQNFISKEVVTIACLSKIKTRNELLISNFTYDL